MKLNLFKNGNFKLGVSLLIITFLLMSSIVDSRLQRSRRSHRSSSSRTSEIGISTYASEVTNNWNRDMAVAYRNLAGLGYIDLEGITAQKNELAKKKGMDKSKVGFLVALLFEKQKWEHLLTYTGDSSTYNYSFTIIRNRGLGKVVCAFSGTKQFLELMNEGYSSYFVGGEVYFREPRSKIMILSYFHKLYKTISGPFLKALERAKDKAIKQYIFVGHSLGGAMASIAAFDSVRSKTLTKTGISPVLITYGQPRTGNYAFSNELSKMIPIIYRHVNNWDIVTKGPACKTSGNVCINEFNKTKLDPKENRYVAKAGSNEFYPWHTGGLIYINGDTTTLARCKSVSEPTPGECFNEGSMDAKFHTMYFGHQISQLPNPEQYGYDLASMNPKQLLAAKPDNAIFSGAKNQNMFSKAMGKTTQWMLKAGGFVAKK